MRYLAFALGLMLAASTAHADMFPNAANAVKPDARQNLELGTVRSEGGTEPNADASTKFYGYLIPSSPADNVVYNYGKIQFQVNVDPESNDWAIEQAGKAGAGATRICTTSIGTTSDCNYISRGWASRHFFGNGAGGLLELGFRNTGYVPPEGSDEPLAGYSRGWIKLTGRDDAVAEISAAGTAKVSLELRTKGGSTPTNLDEKQVITMIGGDDGGLATFASGGIDSKPFVFTTGSGFGTGTLKAGFGGIKLEGQRKATKTLTTAYAVTSPESGTHFDNYLATASVTFTLPIAAEGNNYCFSLMAAFPIVIRANAGDKIALPPTNSVLGGALTSSTHFASVCILAPRPSQWLVYATSDKTYWTLGP